MNLNPTQFEWYNKMTGASLKDSGLVEGTAAFEAAVDNAKAKDAAEQFMAETPDYYKTPDNANTLTDHMAKTGLKPTLAGFKMAYVETKHKLALDPTKFLETPKVPDAVWDMVEAKQSDYSVGVSPSLSSLMALNSSVQKSVNNSGPFSGALGGIAGVVSSGINANVMWETKIKELEADIKKAEETMQPASQIAYMKAELNAKKQSYVQTQIDVYKKQQEKDAIKKQIMEQDYSGSVFDPAAVYYQKSFLDNLKAQTPILYGAGSKKSIPEKKEEPVFDSVSVVDVAQKFIQRVGMASNCNVSVQSKVFGTWPKRTAYRMICDQCQAAEPLNDGSVVTQQRHDDPVLARFCKAHRHETEVPATATTEGRKFRDE